MRRGSGKVRVDFKGNWPGLGAFQFQVEHVMGTTGFWCGAAGRFRVSGLPAGLQCAASHWEPFVPELSRLPLPSVYRATTMVSPAGSWPSATACRVASGSVRSLRPGR